MEIRQILEQCDAFLREGNAENAMEYLETTLDEAAKEQDWITQFGILNELSGLYRDRGRYDDARTCLIGAVEIIGRTGLEESMPAATTFLNVANLYRAEGRLETARDIYLDVEALYLKQGIADYYCLAGLYNNLSVVNLELGNLAGGILYGERAVEFLRMIPGAEAEIGTAYSNLAGAILRMESPDLERARTYLDSAAKLYETACKDNSGFCFVLINKAMLAHREGKREEAKALYEEAMSLVKQYFGENPVYHRLQSEYQKMLAM